MGQPSAQVKLASKPDKSMEQLLSQLSDIPTLPVVANEVSALLNDPNSSSADIAKVLRKDQVLTAKILKLVNSPYYGVPNQVTDVQRALTYLGFNTIAQLVLSVSVFSLFKGDGVESFSLVQFWRHSLAVAVCAEVIAKQQRYKRREEAFTCGLLHDIGKIVLLQINPAILSQIIELASKRKISFDEAERELGLVHHSKIGGIIAEKWGLPEIVRLVIEQHHASFDDLNEVFKANDSALEQRQLVYIVQLANSLVVQMGLGHSGDYSNGGFNPIVHDALGLKPDMLQEIKVNAQEEMNKAGSFLGI